MYIPKTMSLCLSCSATEKLCLSIYTTAMSSFCRWAPFAIRARSDLTMSLKNGGVSLSLHATLGLRISFRETDRNRGHRMAAAGSGRRASQRCLAIDVHPFTQRLSKAGNSTNVFTHSSRLISMEPAVISICVMGAAVSTLRMRRSKDITCKLDFGNVHLYSMRVRPSARLPNKRKSPSPLRLSIVHVI